VVHLLLLSVSHDPNPLAHFWWWVEIHTGSTNESGAFYGWWSGFGGFLVLITGLGAVYKHHKCVTCWRLSKHKTEDTAQHFCHKHYTHAEVERQKAKHKVKYPFHLAHHTGEPNDRPSRPRS
jgi:hypothetical protein